MATRPDEIVRKVTSELNDENLRERLLTEEEINYYPVPHENAGKDPVWRICLYLAYDTKTHMGLDLNGEVILGRNTEAQEAIELIDNEEGDRLGVSRHHAILRPTESKLFIIDPGSTNGTWLNGRRIGINMPYSLSNGDHLMLGHLELIVKIIRRPAGHTEQLRANADLADILPAIAKTISSQLHQKEILKQALEMVMHHTQACESTIWLINERTGELYLEAGQGLSDTHELRLPATTSLAGQVIKSGKSMRVNRDDSSNGQVKIKTGYLVEAVIYVPLTLGGVTFGVLSAAHREQGKMFSQREEKIMMMIADLAATAIQTARQYETASEALRQRIKVITALNYALSYDVKNLANSTLGYAGLLESYTDTDNDRKGIIQDIVETGNILISVIDKLIEITKLSESPINQLACHLTDVVSKAVNDMQHIAGVKYIDLSFELMGTPYMIYGDSGRLYRAVLHLIDNAIRYSPPLAQIHVALIFSYNDIIIRVKDTGPGFPKELLENPFEHYVYNKRTSKDPVCVGLGLQVVQTTIEAHRGTVTLRSAEQGGAEVIITLPTNLRVAEIDL